MIKVACSWESVGVAEARVGSRAGRPLWLLLMTSVGKPSVRACLPHSSALEV